MAHGGADWGVTEGEVKGEGGGAEDVKVNDRRVGGEGSGGVKGEGEPDIWLPQRLGLEVPDI